MITTSIRTKIKEEEWNKWVFRPPRREGVKRKVDIPKQSEKTIPNDSCLDLKCLVLCQCHQQASSWTTPKFSAKAAPRLCERLLSHQDTLESFSTKSLEFRGFCCADRRIFAHIFSKLAVGNVKNFWDALVRAVTKETSSFVSFFKWVANNVTNNVTLA